MPGKILKLSGTGKILAKSYSVLFCLLLLVSLVQVGILKQAQRKGEVEKVVAGPSQRDQALPVVKLLSINGKKIEAETYGQMVEYYREEGKKIDEVLMADIYQEVLEQELLWQEAEERGWTISEAETRALREQYVAKGSSFFENYPNPEGWLRAEIIKERIENELLAWRRMEYLLVKKAGCHHDELGIDSPEALAREKIEAAQARLQKGEDWQAVWNDFYNDEWVIRLNENKERGFFERVSEKNRWIIGATDLTEPALGLQIGETSEILEVEYSAGENRFGLGYILMKTVGENQGDYENYCEWLAATVKKAELEIANDNV